MGTPAWAEKPCDDYPVAKQARCTILWKEINDAQAQEVITFGLKQLTRRQAGEITQEQHMQQNFAFIKESADKRLKLLAERMAKP